MSDTSLFIENMDANEFQQTLELLRSNIERHVTQSHDDLKEIMRTRSELTSAEIGALEDKIKVEFKQVKDKQDYTNGTICEHEERIKKIEKTIIGGWLREHWRLAISLFVLAVAFIYFLLEFTNLTEVLRTIKLII